MKAEAAKAETEYRVWLLNDMALYTPDDEVRESYRSGMLSLAERDRVLTKKAKMDEVSTARDLAMFNRWGLGVILLLLTIVAMAATLRTGAW